jgi:hypothetical protein
LFWFNNKNLTPLTLEPQDLAKVASKYKLNLFERLVNIFVDEVVFSIENDLLTPTFRLIRANARTHYKTQIAEVAETFFESEITPSSSRRTSLSLSSYKGSTRHNEFADTLGTTTRPYGEEDAEDAREEEEEEEEKETVEPAKAERVSAEDNQGGGDDVDSMPECPQPQPNDHSQTQSDGDDTTKGDSPTQDGSPPVMQSDSKSQEDEIRSQREARIQAQIKALIACQLEDKQHPPRKEEEEDPSPLAAASTNGTPQALLSLVSK